MKTQTQIKAGALTTNHNQTVVCHAPAGWSNHNQALVGTLAFVIALLCCSMQAMAADPCLELNGKSLEVNFNGLHGVLGPTGISLVPKNNILTFTTTVQLINEPSTQVTGTCKDRHIQFTRGIQSYNGWIFDAEHSKMAGTFSQNNLENGWSATTKQPPSPPPPLPLCANLDGETCTSPKTKACSKGGGVQGMCYCTRHDEPNVGVYWDWSCK